MGVYSLGSPDKEDPRRRGMSSPWHVIELLNLPIMYCCFVIWRVSGALVYVLLLCTATPGASCYL